MEALRWFVATEEELKAASDASRKLSKLSKLSSANEQVLSLFLFLPPPTPVEGFGSANMVAPVPNLFI